MKAIIQFTVTKVKKGNDSQETPGFIVNRKLYNNTKTSKGFTKISVCMNDATQFKKVQKKSSGLKQLALTSVIVSELKGAHVCHQVA